MRMGFCVYIIVCRMRQGRTPVVVPPQPPPPGPPRVFCGDRQNPWTVSHTPTHTVAAVTPAAVTAVLRVFGGDRIKNLMVAFRVEDLPMESQMLTDALDTAQKRVESYFYDIRK